MKKIDGKSIVLLILILSALMLIPGCAVSKKNQYNIKQKNSYIDTSQIRRNKYFFSNKYQKKLYRFRKD